METCLKALKAATIMRFRTSCIPDLTTHITAEGHLAARNSHTVSRNASLMIDKSWKYSQIEAYIWINYGAKLA